MCLKYIGPSSCKSIAPSPSVLCNNCEVLMPVLSDRQRLIHAAIQHSYRLRTRYYCRLRHLRLGLSRSLSPSTDSGDSNDSDTSTASTLTTSSSGSSSNSNSGNDSHPSDLSSGAEHDRALRSLYHSYSQSTFRMRLFLSTLLSTHVIYPHEVPKCSQLGLVLVCYKDDDPSRSMKPPCLT